MATCKEQIEHLERHLVKIFDLPSWKNLSHSRRWLKKQMHRFMRRQNKKISEDDVSIKTNRKPMKGWEW